MVVVALFGLLPFQQLHPFLQYLDLPFQWVSLFLEAFDGLDSFCQGSCAACCFC